MAIPLTFALFDPDDHPLAVDVGDLEVHDLVGAQPRAVGDTECGLVLEATRALEQAGDFLTAQDLRELARFIDVAHLLHRLGPIERDLEEELQPRDNRVQGGARHPLLDQV